MCPESSVIAGGRPAPALAPAAIDRPAAELVRWSAAAACGFLLLAAAVLCWRRLAGAFGGGPLELPALAAVAAGLAATAAAARLGSRFPSAQRRSTGLPARLLAWLLAAALSIAVLAAGAALSLPQTSVGGLAVLWGILAVEEFWAWRPAAWRRLRAAERGPLPQRRGVRLDPPQRPLPHPIPSAPPADEPPAGDVTQQLTRTHAPDGTETLSGWLRVSLAPGQRVANVHVAFCPPFPRSPQATLKQLDGPEARIKTVQVLPYGARFDLKLAVPSEAPETMLLQLSARATPPTAPSDESPHRGPDVSTFA